MKDPQTQVNSREVDAELVRRVLSGDDAAKDDFCTRHRRKLLLTASSLLGFNDPEAEDMVQETLMAGLKALPGFQFRSSLQTWLNCRSVGNPGGLK